MSGIWTHIDGSFGQGSNHYNKPFSAGPTYPSFSALTTNPVIPIMRGSRARSEPLPPAKNDDVEMGSPEPIPRARSDYTSKVPYESTPLIPTQDERETLYEEDEDGGEDLAVLRGPPSPSETDVYDPDSQDIIARITSKGIKIRDFAYASGRDPQRPSLQPVPEIFDQYRALTEIDYRWSQEERTYPVQGKSLRRLLDMGWLSEADFQARAAPMDIEELEKFDSRPQYPWKHFRRASSPPSLAERRDMLAARRGLWMLLDRQRMIAEQTIERHLDEEKQVALVNAGIEEREREMQSRAKGKGKEALHASTSKRRLENEVEDETDAASDAPVVPTRNKKRRVTPPLSQPAFVAPLKQYPAPLHSYNPEIYPEAASIIESSSQSQSQPRPVVPIAQERSDTPPLDDELESSQGRSPGRGTKLVHPRQAKALKRALSRTQTFAQL